VLVGKTAVLSGTGSLKLTINACKALPGPGEALLSPGLLSRSRNRVATRIVGRGIGPPSGQRRGAGGEALRRRRAVSARFPRRRWSRNCLRKSSSTRERRSLSRSRGLNRTMSRPSGTRSTPGSSTSRSSVAANTAPFVAAGSKSQTFAGRLAQTTRSTRRCQSSKRPEQPTTSPTISYTTSWDLTRLLRVGAPRHGARATYRPVMAAARPTRDGPRRRSCRTDPASSCLGHQHATGSPLAARMRRTDDKAATRERRIPLDSYALPSPSARAESG
jgi:hypothetical protein